jgi:hypothetical protein
MSVISIETYYDTIKHLGFFKYIICIMSFNVYYVNEFCDNTLFEFFSITSFQLK